MCNVGGIARHSNGGLSRKPTLQANQDQNPKRVGLSQMGDGDDFADPMCLSASSQSLLLHQSRPSETCLPRCCRIRVRRTTQIRDLKPPRVQTTTASTLYLAPTLHRSPTRNPTRYRFVPVRLTYHSRLVSHISTTLSRNRTFRVFTYTSHMSVHIPRIHTPIYNGPRTTSHNRDQSLPHDMLHPSRLARPRCKISCCLGQI